MGSDLQGVKYLGSFGNLERWGFAVLVSWT